MSTPCLERGPEPAFELLDASTLDALRGIARESAPTASTFRVACSQCGREYRRARPSGFSHCEDHDTAPCFG